MSTDEILAKLVDLARQIEEHEVAVFVLRQERLELQQEFRRKQKTAPQAGGLIA